MKAPLLAVLLLTPASLPAQSNPAASPPLPEGVRLERDLDYLGPARTEKADLYLPAAASPGELRPAVVIIHGGGWNSGDKANAREINIGTNLALHGYVALSINYRLATGTAPTWPQPLHDCKTAVRWLRQNAARLQVDPDRIGAIGGSAGGHLAAMLALTGPDDGLEPAGPPAKFPTAIRCAVDLYGPVDLLNYHDVKMLGKSRAEAPELYRAASPITYANRGDAPILILHGTADKTVDVKQSDTFAAVLQRAGVEHEFIVIEGAPHTFHLQPKQRDLRPVVLGFFDKHLKAPRARPTPP
jgi:acetyl esterase/lipase